MRFSFGAALAQTKRKTAEKDAFMAVIWTKALHRKARRRGKRSGQPLPGKALPGQTPAGQPLSKEEKAEKQSQRSGVFGKLVLRLKMLGPGLITGASDDDPSGIGTYSQTGALFGLILPVSALTEIRARARRRVRA